MPTPPSGWRSRSSPGPTWCGGRPETRSRCGVGSPTGPVVAGVIGERKFAYDVWGDTVNLASRLQEAGEPGQVLVSQRTAEVIHRYGCGPVQMVDIKGKGATPVRALIGPEASSADGEPSVEVESS